MNYYPFHIGDYLSATRHLSWEEDAAYRRLLDIYYTNETPLPAELRAVCRLVLATTEIQREAVSTVLQEFFELTDEGWVNHRADAEIDAMRAKQQKQRDKANKRWHKPVEEPGNAPAMPQHQKEDATASKNDADAMPPTPTPTPTPTPISKPNGLEGEARETRPTRKCPAGFELTDAMREWAGTNAPAVNIDTATAAFRDHTFKTAISDWPGAWRNWLRREQQYAAERQRPAPGAPINRQEALEARNRAAVQAALNSEGVL
jgi:uncharacterized protein YdaU (DUF1376 family)